MANRRKVNLESLITEEELQRLTDIRIKELPEFVEKIGTGGFGDVNLYRFNDGSSIAGKIPRINIFSKSSEEEEQIKKTLSRTLDEMRTLHQLDHDRVIKLFGIYLDKDQIIIFMEYMMKGSVKDEISTKKYLSEFQAMHYFLQAAEGLDYLHSRKPNPIVHRDIKSDNLLLTEEYNVKLADFGLAVDIALKSGSITNTLNAPASMAGTHHFMAPEVIRTTGRPEAYGRQSDIWSLACTLVEMVSGKPPYKDVSIFEIFERFKIGSNNLLVYSGDQLLPAASIATKELLNTMFKIDSQLRPSANSVLALARDIKKKIVYSITDVNEQVNIGNMYEKGDGMPQSYEEAMKWYKRAAEQGHMEAKTKLQIKSEYHENDVKGTIPNYVASVAAEKQNSLSSSSNEENYQQRQSITAKTVEPSNKGSSVKNLVNRFQEQMIAANHNEEKLPNISRDKYHSDSSSKSVETSAEAQSSLEEKYYYGQNVLQPHPQVAGHENVEAEEKLPIRNKVPTYEIKRIIANVEANKTEQGMMIHSPSGSKELDNSHQTVGMVVEPVSMINNKAKYVFNSGRKSEETDAVAQCNLGEQYYYGRGVPQSDVEAVKWYKRAAEQGLVEAQFSLALMNEKGEGVPQSYEEAMKWYRRAAEQGDANGQSSLGEMHENGRGVPQSFGEAAKWYRRAAEHGHAKSQWKLGALYENGRGVPQSSREAVKWYKISAEGGNAGGQNSLGEMYCYGRGVAQSYQEAVKWFRSAAEQGCAGGQRNLGYMHQNGWGVPQSDEEAVIWYKKAARQGDLYARANLKAMNRDYGGTIVAKTRTYPSVYFK